MEAKIQKPDHIKLIPSCFTMSYYTYSDRVFMVGRASPKYKNRLGKSDYTEWNRSVFDSAEWSGRKKGQPFFAKICLNGGKARSQARASKIFPCWCVQSSSSPYCETSIVLEDWAAYLDTFSLMDFQVGQIIDRLKKEGSLNTIIFFITDHGVSHARVQFCCWGHDDSSFMLLIELKEER